jgi:chromate reductase, NAD(P)H dehydrogenase (quinone)
MRILAIAGSLRADSHNRRLLEAAVEPLEARGAEVEILGSDALRSLPHFEEDIESDPGEAVERLREAIAGADGLLIATPEYNSSIPGVIKNAVDWASRPRAEASIARKPVAVIGASTTPFGAVWAQAELRKVLGSAGARVVDGDLPLGSAQDGFDETGRIVHEGHSETLAGLLDELVSEVEKDRVPVAA